MAMNQKRLIVATLAGLFFGLVCFALASQSPGGLPAPIAWQIIASRTLIGFALGISCFKMHHWAIRGIIIGGLFSLPMAFSGLMAEVPGFSPASMFSWTVGLGMVYGALIELITSVMFKARI